MNFYERYGNKSYIRIPFGEIQFGHKSRRLVVWFRGKRLVIRKGLPVSVWTKP